MTTDIYSHVIGHARIVELLAREVQAPGQAYLFTGAESVGKSTIALAFAQALSNICEGLSSGAGCCATSVSSRVSRRPRRPARSS